MKNSNKKIIENFGKPLKWFKTIKKYFYLRINSWVKRKNMIRNRFNGLSKLRIPQKIFLLTPCLYTFTFAQFDWINDGVPLRQGVHIEWQRTGDITPDGEMIFAWSDTRNGIRDIFAQKVNSNGEKLWSSDGIAVVTAEGRQEDPILISDENGGAFVIWADYKNEPDTEGDVYGQHILSDGSLAWDESGIALTNKSGRQTSLNMCSDGEGGVFAIWKDFEPSSYGHIYGTHISSDGTIVNQGEGLPIVEFNSYKGFASLEYGGTGSAVLIWQDERFGNGNGIWDEGEPFSDDNENGVWDEGEWYEELNGVDLFSQRISHENGELTVHWSTTEEGGKHICNSLKDQINPRVTHFNEFKTVIVWEDNRINGLTGNSKNDIYIQILDESGENLLTENGEPISEGNWVKQLPRVKTDGTFAFVVWEDERQSPNWLYKSDIFGQKVDMNGAVSWTENGRQIVSYERKQEQVRLTPDGMGGVYIGWEDERLDSTPEIEIYLQHIDASGNELAENGISICSADYKQIAPLLKEDGSGGVYILWEDQRTGSAGIYLQHLNSSQELSLAEDGEEQYYGIGTDSGGHSYSMGSLYLDEDENLLYWQDLRSGKMSYGQKISSNFGNEALDNGTKLCSDPYQSIEAQYGEASKIKVEKNATNLLLGYLNDESEYLASYQHLNLDLSWNDEGAGQFVDPGFDSQPAFDIVVGEDGYFYYVYSKWIDFLGPYFTDIFIQKFDSNGNPQWESPIRLTEEPGEENVKSLHPLSGGGCVVLYEFSSGGYITIRSIGVTPEGTMASGWESSPVDLTSISNVNQYYEGSIHTGEFVFISWKDTRGDGYDVYGQFLGMDGTLLGNEDGIEIAGYMNDQDNSTVALNNQGNEIAVCWEDNQYGNDADINCSFINLSNYEVGELIHVAQTDDEEMNPFVHTSINGTYLITWENRVGGLDTDIFYQELNNGINVHDENGISVCGAPFDQMNPQIDLYSETDNSYIIFWDDKRSTGKAELTNIFCQSVSLSSEGGMEISYMNDWNLIGLPMVVPDNSYIAIFPDAIPGTLYSFEGTYTQVQELDHGTGYWLRFENSGSTTLTGESLNNLTVSLATDWNLISGVTQSIDFSQVDDPDGIIVPGTLYGFSGTYEQASSLEPGKGYWVRTTSSGDIIISSSSRRVITSFRNELADANKIRINGLTLYFGKEVGENEKLSYSLPPKPPSGAKDIRFAGDTKLCSSDECIIEVMNDGQPLIVECDVKDGEEWEIIDKSGKVFKCEGVQVLEIESKSKTFVLKKSTSPQTPTEFLLFPAYPNPFNPVTTIQYSVPDLSEVNISIFDVQGRLIETIVNEELSPGNYSIWWDASSYSSGVYFYSIEAGQFRDMKKMVLVK